MRCAVVLYTDTTSKEAVVDFMERYRRRKQREYRRQQRRWYFIKQRLFGIALLVFTVLATMLLDGGANADDTADGSKELYRVTLFHKGDFEAQLEKTLEVLTAAGAYINGVDTENYETDTGYWLVPITIEILKE